MQSKTSSLHLKHLPSKYRLSPPRGSIRLLYLLYQERRSPYILIEKTSDTGTNSRQGKSESAIPTAASARPKLDSPLTWGNCPLRDELINATTIAKVNGTVQSIGFRGFHHFSHAYRLLLDVSTPVPIFSCEGSFFGVGTPEWGVAKRNGRVLPGTLCFKTRIRICSTYL